jgi:23S rRNA (adenine1618-N6)-methyltransferase
MELCGDRHRWRQLKLHAIIEQNPQLVDAISLQQQTESRFIFKNIILEDRFTFTICNPPFHKSLGEATKGTIRKFQI